MEKRVSPRRAVALAVAITLTVTLACVQLFLVGSGLWGLVGASREELASFSRQRELKEIVQTRYFQEVDEQLMLDGASRGLLQSIGDPYTFYYTPADMKAMNEHTTGKYAGVGMQLIVSEDDRITVTRAFTGSPADLAGVRPGDQILKVDGEEFSGYTLDKAVTKMKAGEAGSEVVVTLLTPHGIVDLTMKRQEITINRVEYEMIGDIGYVQIYEFMGDDVTGFLQALTYFEEHNAKGVVIDVRDNPGGSLADVVKISDQLCPEGLIVYTEDRFGNRDERRGNAGALDLPLAVLINGMSASASEILAGAVQDYGVGTIIGTQSFGKGIVQGVLPFANDGAGMQLTISRYFTPKGRSIHGVGITPDIVVEMPQALARERAFMPREQDPQLQKALEVLQQEIKK